MRFVIVTGMSGAGKTTALKMLEDMGYFCVDNLPIAMFPGFVQMIENSETPMKKASLGWTTKTHTGAPVPLYAIGKQAVLYSGRRDNTDMANVLRKLFLIK